MEIQRVDPRIRLLLLFVYLASAIIGAIIIWWIERWLAGLKQIDPNIALHQVLTGFIYIHSAVCAIILVFSIYLWRTGAKVRNIGQFPLPGMFLLRDTVILRGAAARRQALILQSISIVLMLFCIALFIAGWKFYFMAIAM